MRRKKERKKERKRKKLWTTTHKEAGFVGVVYWYLLARLHKRLYFFSFSNSTPFSLTDLLHQIYIQQKKRHTSSGKSTCLPSNRSLYRRERGEEKGWVTTQLQLCWRPQSRWSLRSHRKSHLKFCGLRRQLLVSPRNDVRNKHRNSTLMTCHYPDLRRVSDWSCGERNLFRKFASTNQKLYPDVAGRPVVTSRNVGSLFRLKNL